jgi:ABC-type multidrug transport system ATPase subunit/pSer/pThr/pTyr-binding forkhead associated (FHA) protein
MTAHGGALAKIIIQAPGGESKELLLSRPVITLGRRQGHLIQLESPIMADDHARIEFTNNGHTLTDLGSANGTRVNGQLLTPHKARLLNSQDIIRFTDSRGNSIKLIYVEAAGFGNVDTKSVDRSYQLEADVSFIGRGFDAAIVLSHPTVSWYHAKVTRQAQERYLIEDVSRHNGVFLNGRQLEKAQLLERGDVVQIGPFNLVYQEAGLFSAFRADRNFRLEATGLEKTVYEPHLPGFRNQQAKKLLHKVDLVINPREFVALVGGSGSGKSTLMKALLGLRPASAGVVLVNGDDLYKHLEVYRRLIGYVPQDDIVHPHLRVRQALCYAYQLRVPDNGSDAVADRQIDEVLAKLNLTAQAETLIGHLSGGQRKRVSIAAELLADPWIFFLDEPTSGLDPGLEKLMMDTLRQLADEGRTIVLVTHATGHILDHCDQVAFMAGGELAYFGPPASINSFFGVDNFPDIYTVLSQSYRPEAAVPPELKETYDELNGQDARPAEIEASSLWAARYRRSDIYQTFIRHRQSGEMARPIKIGAAAIKQGIDIQFRQFKILTRRYLDLIKADRLALWLLTAVLPLMALFLLLINEPAVLVGNSAPEIAASLETVGHYSIAAGAQTLLFMMALSTSFLGLFGAAYEVVKEEAIYRRERMLGLKVWPYILSKFVALGGLMVLQLALFLAILAVKLQFPAAGAIVWAPLEYFVTLLLIVLASLALGLFISALASSKEMVTYLVLIVILIQILFSGAIFELSSLTEPLSYLTITRWGLEALGISTNLEQLNLLGQVRVEHALDTGRGLQTLVKDVASRIDFYLNYTPHPLALVSRWIFLIAHSLFWTYLAIWRMRQKDEI